MDPKCHMKVQESKSDVVRSFSMFLISSLVYTYKLCHELFKERTEPPQANTQGMTIGIVVRHHFLILILILTASCLSKEQIGSWPVKKHED